MRPVLDNIIVKPLPNQEQRSPGGLTISINNTTKKGSVVAVGPGTHNDGQQTPIGVKVGDVLAYQERSGISFNWNGEQYILLTESDILFVDDGVK